MRAFRSPLRLAFEKVEDWFDAAFRPAWNPFYQLGALGWFFYWIVVATGVYLYVFFDTGITNAYLSVEYLTHEQWYAGGVMRSLHRYASDALVIVVMVHLLREYAHDRYRGKRWFAWVTGVPLIWFLYACGISGYWLVWDKLAQYIAVITTEWLDTLPFFAEPIARNFLNSVTLGGRFFTLMVFIHIAVPLIMLFLMWLHIQRHSLPKVNPPKGLAIGTLATMIVLSLVYPALSQGPADLDVVTSVIRPDWFYIPLYPLLDHVSGLVMWFALAGMTVLLFFVPWLPPARKESVAVVNLDNCNGCGRCVADCPYSAITMVPRTDGLPFAQQVTVNESNCTSCGLCVGACPTATPFRRATALVPGIDLPDLPVKALAERVREAGATSRGEDGEPRVVVFSCRATEHAPRLERPGVEVIEVPCLGQIPPPLLDFTLARGHADGVFLAGCREGDCHFRLGANWTEQRIDRQRDPYLRARVPRERLELCWGGPTRARRTREALDAFRERLRALNAEKADKGGPDV